MSEQKKSTRITIKRALISVSDKTGIENLVNRLHQAHVEIISTGGTAKAIESLGIPVTPIQEITGNPEAFDGRMKSISFQVSSGILFDRNNSEHVTQAKDLNIKPIDLVVCNLYPFEETLNRTNDLDELISNIDIGGPTMIRAAAKNFHSVVCLSSPNQYEQFQDEFRENQISVELSQSFSAAAFAMTAAYDSAIANTMSKYLPAQQNATHYSRAQHFTAGGRISSALRYGENPDQEAFLVQSPLKQTTPAQTTPIQGKALSYNNLLDADSSWRLTSELHNIFVESTPNKIATIFKHLNPCGCAIQSSTMDALEYAWAGDPTSAFGSIICTNFEIDADTAEWFSKKFIEIIIAPSFSNQALDILAKKKNLRLMACPPQSTLTNREQPQINLRSISGGLLIQTDDVISNQDYKDLEALEIFGIICTKALKSNAIGIVSKENLNDRPNSTGFWLTGTGMGQPNRIDSLSQAIARHSTKNIGNQGSILVSDAFFPFADSIETAAAAGFKHIVQPGGSIRDEEVLTKAKELDVKVTMTGRRHFYH